MTFDVVVKEPHPNNFYGQFVLRREEGGLPDGYRTFDLNSWTMSSHRSLPVTEIYTIDDVHIGWVIGHLIDIEKGAFIEDKMTFPFNTDTSSNLKDSIIDDFLYSFGGRYICIIVDKGIQRLYLDAAGSLACVYSADNGIVASSPGLILDKKRYYAELDDELYQLLGMPQNGWYPSGLTPHTSFKRLLPNHYLDLPSWKPIRHWPCEMMPSYNEPREAVKVIIDVIKSTIKAIGDKFRVYLPLTAGRDSRALLACSREVIQNIQFITFVNQKETVDEHIVKILAVRFNLNVRFLRTIFATEEQISNWLFQVGHCVGGRILEIHQTLNQLHRERLILPSFGAEVGRGRYWKLRDRKGTRITGSDLLQRFRLPGEPRLLRSIEEWLSEISHLSAFQILDLAHIEQRLGSWGGPQTYGQVKFVDHLYPFVHRTIFKEALLMPPRYKRNNCLPRDICLLEWPELLDVPFNRFKGVRDITEKVRKIKRGLSKVFSIIANR